MENGMGFGIGSGTAARIEKSSVRIFTYCTARTHSIPTIKVVNHKKIARVKRANCLSLG